MKKEDIQAVLDGFNALKIKVDPKKLQSADMPDSVTNRFLTVKAANDKTYLVRLNGQLWPPFTRQDESLHLAALKGRHVDTHVLLNAPVSGIQICRLPEAATAKRHSELSTLDQQRRLASVAETVYNVHHSQQTDIVFAMHNTLISCFRRLDKRHQAQLAGFFYTALRLVTLFNADQEHHVFAHNDLLPSSVYHHWSHTAIVDWEYAGRNHLAYDLALFSIKASLTPQQKYTLLKAYNTDEANNLSAMVTKMRPIVFMFGLLWNGKNFQHDDVAPTADYTKVLTACQLAESTQSAKSLFSEATLFSTAANTADTDTHLVPHNSTQRRAA